MRKKVIFSAYSLDIGGIEKALVTLINNLVEKDYDITLALEKKQGIFLNDINKEVKIIEYTPSYCKNRLIAKFINGLKRAKFIIKYKNKFDCSISFATYSLSGSFIARTASHNPTLWVHNNYLAFFDYDKEKYVDFFKDLSADKFNNIVFVSNEAKNDFKNIVSTKNPNLLVCNNLVNYKEMKEKSLEKINYTKDNNILFVNVGRHDEKQKKLSRLIEAAKRLKEDGYKFKIVLVGSGEDTGEYKEKVKALDLQEIILFEGAKKNPYPYYRISDCVILTSEFEGYPVVYLESFVFNKPIITTNVSDSKEDIENKHGFVCEKNVEDIYSKMKEFMNNGFKIHKQFNAENFNKEIMSKVERIINN